MIMDITSGATRSVCNSLCEHILKCFFVLREPDVKDNTNLAENTKKAVFLFTYSIDFISFFID